MSNNATLARPYAKASYAFALEKNQVAKWHSALLAVRQIVEDGLMQQLLVAPSVSTDDIEKIVVGALPSNMVDEHIRNFFKLLIKNKRLLILPELVVQFEAIKDRDENVVNVNVATAVELTEEVQAKLTTAISAQLDQQVHSSFEIDPSLIAGAVIRIGDISVVDCSMRARLSQLRAQFLTQNTTSDKR